MAGAPSLCRVELGTGGALVGCGDPWTLESAPDDQWTALDDGWSVRIAGEADPVPRRQPGLRTVLAPDGQGRQWLVPAVLDPEGQVALPLRLGIAGRDLVDGQAVPRWEHMPTTAQRRLITIATTIRTEVAAGRIAELPAAAAADMTAQLLSATYHLSPAVIGALALIDDRLLVTALLLASGHPEP